MIKITYLITVFNEVKTVKKAIEDIINIKYDNKEIIIIDNASTDGSQEIIKNFHNIKHIIREKNLGYGSTVTEGLKIAKGKYIYIHNSDLEYDHLKSLDMMNYAEKYNLDVVFGSRLKNQNNIIKNLRKHPAYLATYVTTFLINILYKKKFTDIVGSKLYKVENLRNIKTDFLFQGFDFGFVSRICKEKFKIDEIYVDYEPRENFADKKIKWYHMFVALFAIFKVKFFD
tara:strand:- start:718 stop:1404 length:687 start_codon:yes stop_codon:yes gene_type:complete